MIGARRSSAPTGLPGEQQQALKRRADKLRQAFNILLGCLGFIALLALVGPSRAWVELPPLGPAAHDLVAQRDFDDEEPAPDLQAALDRAVAAVPIHYTFDGEAVRKRTTAIHDAFRTVRPRYRLYLADRERLAAGEPDHKDNPIATVTAVAQLDKAIDAELDKLKPEFESSLVGRHSELTPEMFTALRRAGFSEDVELLLADTAQLLLSQRIVRDMDRFDDDLQRGVWDEGTGAPFNRSSGGHLVDLEAAQKQAEDSLTDFMRQKNSTRLDDPMLQAALKALARTLPDVTFARDTAATRAAEEGARLQVPKIHVVHIARGQSLVKRGDVVTAALQQRVARMQAGLDDDSRPRAFVASAVLLGITLLLFGIFAGRHLHHFRYRPRDGHLLASILLMHAGVMRVLLWVGQTLVEPGGQISAAMWTVGLPFALGPTLATLFLKPFTAAPFALVCSVVAVLMAHNSTLIHGQPTLEGLIAVQAVVLGLGGVHAARHFRQRSDLILGAMTISGVGMVCGIAVALFTAPSGADIFDLQNLWIAAMGAGAGVVCYLLLSALTPVFETLFNRLTDIKLLELTSMNHPALRLLATEAPGTFTHSVTVGNLAQAGCDAIGANGLLARVGAYYHDVGKTKNPRYFAENQANENPHDKLKPHLSALIIRSHVKDGIKLLKSMGLPDEIIDFVPQHHGTSLIAHFYHRAQREAQDGEEISETDFRYPGPKPQRRETAMLMLADAVEAACKALPEPNPMRIQAVVKKIIAGKMEDGQFEECDLTLRELALVEQAFIRVVMGIHHSRPVYLPAPTVAVQQSLPLSLAAQSSTQPQATIGVSDAAQGATQPVPPAVRFIAMAQSERHGQRPVPIADLADEPSEPAAPTAVVAAHSSPSRLSK